MQLIAKKKCWNILEKNHVGDEKLKKVQLQTLKRQFELLLVEPSENIAENFNKVTCDDEVFDQTIMNRVMHIIST